jgi:hypothetical protein
LWFVHTASIARNVAILCRVGLSAVSMSGGVHVHVGGVIRLGIGGIVDILQLYFAVISEIFRIQGIRKHHEIRRYSPDDIIDP